MATATLKVLGQLDSATPGAGTDGTLYTVPGATTAVVSTITVCNRSTSTAATYNIRVRVNSAGDDNKQFISNTVNLLVSQTQTLSLGVSLGANDQLRVQASTTSVTFQAFGQENS